MDDLKDVLVTDDMERSLSIKDINLLLASYRNQVEMQTMIVDQLKKVMDTQKRVLEKQDDITGDQKKLIDSLKDITDKLDSTVTELKSSQQTITTSNTNLSNSLDSKSNDLKNDIGTFRHETQGSVSSLINKIHLGWIGMGTIILGILGLIIAYLDKNNHIMEILKNIESIIGVR
jgi:hypothetical protein